MRPQAPPPKAAYVYQEYPKSMYPGTELLGKGLTRTKTVNSAEEEATIAAQGYQATQAAPPVVAATSTKEEALAKQQEQFDAAWDRKVAELQALQIAHGALLQDFAELKSDRDVLAKRLAVITEKMAAEKKAAAKPAAAVPAAKEGEPA